MPVAVWKTITDLDWVPGNNKSMQKVEDRFQTYCQPSFDQISQTIVFFGGTGWECIRREAISWFGGSPSLICDRTAGEGVAAS